MVQSAENSEVATMKLSSKNGRPFMIFEIIVSSVINHSFSRTFRCPLMLYHLTVPRLFAPDQSADAQ